MLFPATKSLVHGYDGNDDASLTITSYYFRFVPVLDSEIGRTRLPGGCNGKTPRCMRGYESVYIIPGQIFCTRNDGVRCVPASRDPPCYSLYVLSNPSTSETVGGRTDEKGTKKERHRGEER